MDIANAFKNGKKRVGNPTAKFHRKGKNIKEVRNENLGSPACSKGVCDDKRWKKKKAPKKKAPPADDDLDLDDDALLDAAIKANAKEKKREPEYRRWIDADGNVKGNTLHSRQAERDRAALLAKLEKKKAGAARDTKKPTKGQQK